MNKTPIQELIDWVNSEEDLSTDEKYVCVDSVSLSIFLYELQQKEKQFAFECFSAGESYCSYHCGPNLEESPDFEQFYSQYVEQHKK